MQRSPITSPVERAVNDSEFGDLMAAVAPFESKPKLAIACSGGADSMALAHLVHNWVAKRQGIATALIVDHGIRDGSGEEAVAVAAELSRHDVGSRILRHSGPKLTGDIQATARNIRYRLLYDWCEAQGYLHLAVAHHRDDQAETVLLRLARGSGVDGLAAMAPIVETRSLRIIRPLLTIPARRLRATLMRRDITHVEDPSNRNPEFARVRMRDLASTLSAEGMTARRMAETASRMARGRTALEGAVAKFLGRNAVLHDQGYCLISRAGMRLASEEVGLRALARLLMCVSGSPYTARLVRLERLYDWILEGTTGGGRTLSGCRILPSGDGLLICREASAARSSLPARGRVFWDGRFRLQFGKRSVGEVRRLGTDGWRQAVAIAPELRNSTLPRAARAGLPSVWKGEALISVPHLGLMRGKRLPNGRHPHRAVFAPRRPLAPARFTLQKGGYTLSK